MTITLLDGGMGQELIRRSTDTPTPLWSTQVMIDRPGLVAEVHRDFAEAGADITTTNTYAILRDRLVSTPHEGRFEELYKMAIQEAKDSGAKRIAGSMGPIGASYRPDLHPADNVAASIYNEIADILAPECDLLIGETITSVAHARSILKAALRTDVPVWLAMTVDDSDGTKLRSGEPLADAMAVAQQGASAILVNCSTPEVIPAAMDVLSHGTLPFGAYANGFEKISDGFLKAKPTVDALTARRDLGPEAYADHAAIWVAKGATLVGGCCEVGPAHIAELSKRFKGLPA